ncbi:MAG: GNAT family N-acetyltransferase [Acidiferrobacteraceae bacterium]
MDLVIRDARPEEFPAIADLNVAAYRAFAPQMSTEGWSGMERSLRAVETRAERATFLVARLDSTLAGSVGYCPPGRSDPAVFPPEWASIVLLAVAPEHRRRGVGQGLVAACLRRAQDDHATTIGLFTSELMTSARRLYEQAGFVLDVELPRRHGLRY